ncbi:MAG: tetraacyldisaccharide 4'-kinase [Odoribacteraceae bacterium]|jgi:tetraacyldisaccharide 4'-kinase|nr:tetraacyldisaccharide 4'-kinase [Odoribacteraceae bacterium]
MNVQEMAAGALGLPAALYGAGIAVRNRLFDWNILPSRRFDVPVICVGNITVGGTGKTPHVEALVATLGKEYRVACLSRGYKRKTRGFLLVEKHDDPARVGDEPAQIKNKFPGITVAVDGHRVRGIEHLLALSPRPEIIIMDDGFQHRHVKPDITIVLMDYRRPVYTDHLLPRGRLREPASALRRADFIIVTKCPPGISPAEQATITRRLAPGARQRVLFTTMSYGSITPLDGTSPCHLSPDTPILCLTGIAQPAPYQRHVETLAGRVIPLPFADHHAFSGKDIRQIIKKYREIPSNCAYIFTTEKDATRLSSLSLPPEIAGKIFYIPIEPRFITPADVFIQTITEHARQNKRG